MERARVRSRNPVVPMGVTPPIGGFVWGRLRDVVDCGVAPSGGGVWGLGTGVPWMRLRAVLAIRFRVDADQSLHKFLPVIPTQVGIQDALNPDQLFASDRTSTSCHPARAPRMSGRDLRQSAQTLKLPTSAPRSASRTKKKRAPGSVHGTNPVGSLLKMSTAHYLTWIPIDPGGQRVITPVCATHLNIPGSTGFVDDEHWTFRSRVASLLVKRVDK